MYYEPHKGVSQEFPYVLQFSHALTTLMFWLTLPRTGPNQNPPLNVTIRLIERTTVAPALVRCSGSCCLVAAGNQIFLQLGSKSWWARPYLLRPRSQQITCSPCGSHTGLRLCFQAPTFSFPKMAVYLAVSLTKMPFNGQNPLRRVGASNGQQRRHA